MQFDIANFGLIPAFHYTQKRLEDVESETSVKWVKETLWRTRVKARDPQRGIIRYAGIDGRTDARLYGAVPLWLLDLSTS